MAVREQVAEYDVGDSDADVSFAVSTDLLEGTGFPAASEAHSSTVTEGESYHMLGSVRSFAVTVAMAFEFTETVFADV